MSTFGFIDWSTVLLVVGGLFALIGAITFGAILWDILGEWFDRRRETTTAYGFSPVDVDRGTQLLDYADAEVLRSVAVHHDLEPPPTKIEKRRNRGVQGGSKALKGTADNGTTTTLEPYDDLADLLRRLLKHLHGEGELNQTADCVLADAIADDRIPPPFVRSEDEARTYFEEWLTEQYPDGLENVGVDELAAALAGVGRTPPGVKVRDAVVANFKTLQSGSEQLLFLEGEWAIEEANGQIVLSRTNLRLSYGVPGDTDGASSSLPMPDGVSIKSRFDATALTNHGRNRMVGVTQPIRACMVGTMRQYDENCGCLEIVPVAVFQRIA